MPVNALEELYIISYEEEIYDNNFNEIEKRLPNSFEIGENECKK